jgi:hypothetical protein
MKPAASVGALAASLLLLGLAHAQNGPESAGPGGISDAPAAAEALFEEGVRLYEAGKLESACHKLEASETLDVAVGTLLRLADCYERLGRTASAWARFREARSLARAQGMPARERIAAERADALEPKLCRLVINVGHAPPALSLSLGGTTVPPASWGSPIPVDPGQLMLEATAPGYLTLRKQISVPAQEGALVTFELPAAVPELAAVPAVHTELAPVSAARRPKTERHDTGSTTRGVGVTLTSVGLAGLAGSGVLALLAARRNDDSLRYCPDDPQRCTPRGVELRRDAAGLADYATLSAALGGALVVSGVVVFVLASDKPSRERIALEAAPDPTSGAWSLRARGAF